MLYKIISNILFTLAVWKIVQFIVSPWRCFSYKFYNVPLRNIYTLEEIIMAVPKLIVFDLDYTLWPFWVDTHVAPPFHKASNEKVYDAHKNHVRYYKDVPEILRRLHDEGFKLGIASRTGATREASDLTRLFNWDQYFHYRQIYPGSKITHFKKLHTQSGIDFEDMLFFDDEHRNIADVSTLGVCCYYVANGVTNAELKRGFKEFADTEVERILEVMEKFFERPKRQRKSRRSNEYDESSASSISS